MAEVKAGSGSEPASAYRALKREALDKNCLRLNGANEFMGDSTGAKVEARNVNKSSRGEGRRRTEGERGWGAEKGKPICL